MGRKLSEPPPSWKIDLNETDRKILWKEAAGPNKTKRQHQEVRSRFTRIANEEAATAKNGVGLTKEEIKFLERKRNRASARCVWNRANRDREQDNAKKRAWLKTPKNREKNRANSVARDKANRDALQAERAVVSIANGGRTTDFGLGEVSREDEIECGAYNLMQNPAGLHPYGDATITNWIKDHGPRSIEEVLKSGDWAAYFFVTKQRITPGEEIKCRESTHFMYQYYSDPLWRMDSVDNDNQCDFRRFTRQETKTVVRSYLLANCISAFDATGLEGALQRYIEELGLPHGFCLHKKAGAGSMCEYGKTKPEATWVAISMIRVQSPKFADVDPVDPNRNPPLTSCTVTSHDCKTDYKVAVRGDKQKFPRTTSVLKDEAKIKAWRLQNSTRHKKRKADAMTSEDDKSSE
jgi:hypothetical protein